jgi:putative nucleotidyltransferase with HDIG domain
LENLVVKMNEILSELKTHDIQTYNHCLRVSQLSRFLAEAAELTEYEKLLAQISGLLHDVGKMKIPKDVLHKPSKLTEEEYMLVQKHSIFSAELLEPLEESSFFREVQLAVLHHHERIDGKGYPFELEGEQIPYISRLILIVDTVDAMTQDRAYRKGLPMEVAYQELEKHSGSQFDKELVTIFIASYKKLLSQTQRAEVITLTKKIKAA